MSHDFIDEVKRNLTSSLPTASSIVGEVIKTIYDRSSSAQDLARIIERDPALTMKVLKAANSAYYGSSANVTSLQRAIVVLGFDTVKQIVMNMTVMQYFFQTDSDSEIDRSGLWLHSVGTAKAAQLLSNNLGIERQDVAYTIGLIHDIGKILLALSFPLEYTTVVRMAREKKCHIILAERKILNTDHCMIGKILADMWYLPEELSNAILFHHDPMAISKGSQALVLLANIGDQMCRKAKIGNPGDDVVPELSRATLANLGYSPAKIQQNYNDIYQKFIAERDEITGFFSGLN